MIIPSWPQAGEREAELLKSVLESPQWGGFHPFVAEFEQSFAAFQHSKHGISAFNGTITLELALQILGAGPGVEVIVPAVSFISTASAVSRSGALPVFVDLEPWSFHMDPARVEEAITPQTRGIVVVHFGGPIAQMDLLRAIAAKHGLWLLEDAAHAHGSEWRGQRAGSLGICGSFSFQNGKVLCAGEGGLLTTNDDRFAETARSVANQGRILGESFYLHGRVGTNFRMGGFQAAILLAQFECLPEQISRRTAAAKRLQALLADCEEIVWQHIAPEVTQNSFYLMPGRLRGGRVSRDEFQQSLATAGVPCTPFYPHTLYQNPAYRVPASCRVMPCPQAEAYVKDAFWFPHRLLLADEETINEVAMAIRSALGRK